MYPQMQWHQWNRLRVELSLHAGSLIDVEKIVHVHGQKGNMEVLLAIYHVSEECMDLLFRKITFHTCCTSKPSVILIIHSTFQQQQQNRGKLHKHNMHITIIIRLSFQLKPTNAFRSRKTSKISKTCGVQV